MPTIDEDHHTCPSCGRTGLIPNARYPRYVCSDCAAQVVSEDGRPLRFGNVSFTGGFAAHYADDGSPYEHRGRCWIRGTLCSAREARFGGIVVQVVDDERPS